MITKIYYFEILVLKNKRVFIKILLLLIVPSSVLSFLQDLVTTRSTEVSTLTMYSTVGKDFTAVSFNNFTSYRLVNFRLFTD